MREAHPEMLKEGNKTGVVGNPKDLKERVILATQCVSQYRFSIPMVLDGMDGKVNQDYQAAPVRVTVVDIEGKVAFYAGKGPADFRIPPVERTLKKLIANHGRMPPAPMPQWGEPVNGLRCGLSFDPQKFTLGDEVVIRLLFENTTDKPIGLLYDPGEALRNVVVRPRDGQTLRVQPANTRPAPRGKAGNRPLQGIRPGQVYESEIEGRIVVTSDGTPAVAGQYRAIYNTEVTEGMLPPEKPTRRPFLWTGKISSGVCPIDMALTRPSDN